MLYNGFDIDIYGESHSEYIGVKVYGIEKGKKIDLRELSAFLERRKSKLSSTTLRREPDIPEILSGIKDGKTDGNVLEIRFRNADINKKDYEKYKNIPRPSTADYPRMVKFGDNCTTGGGAFSGRMTLPICAVGGVLLQILKEEGIEIDAHILSVGKIKGKPYNPLTGELKEDKNFYKKICNYTEKVKKSGDSLGGVIECKVTGLKVGVGGELFKGIESAVSLNMFAIPSVKGIEFGSGFKGAKLKGSENNDEFLIEDGKVRTKTNNAGGILGGMANGMPVIFKVAFKPVPSIRKVQQSVDIEKNILTKIKIEGRHDACAVLRASAIVESATAIALYPMIKKENCDLTSLREQIDVIDYNILELIEERKNIVLEIGKIKKDNSLKIEDKKREKEIIENLTDKFPNQKDFIEKIYPEIFEISKKVQEDE